MFTRVLVLLAATVLAILPTSIGDQPAIASHSPLATIASQGETVSLPGTTFRIAVSIHLLSFGDPQISAAGEVAFAANSTEGPCAVLRDSAVGSPSLVAADGDVPPAPYSGQPLGVCFPSTVLPTSDPLVNSASDVAFQARLMTSAQWALWFRPPAAPLSLVVREGATTPIGGTYGKPELLDFNDAGQVLFTAANSGVPTLWRWTSGAVTKIVAVGDTLPESGGTVTALSGASMNASGQVAWRTTATGGGGAGGRISLGIMPGPTKVVEAGDVWFTGPPQGDIHFTAVSEPDILDDGSVGLRATADAPYGGRLLPRPAVPAARRTEALTERTPWRR